MGIVVQRSSGGVEQRSRAAGIDSLMFLLQSFCNKNSSSSAEISVGVVGIRGVGKKTLIDTLKRSKVFCSEKRIKLSQVPGEVTPEDNDDENGNNAFEKAEAFVERCDARFLQLKYDVPSFETAAEFLALIKASSTLAKKKGGKGGNGEKDLESAAIDFMKDVDGSAFKFCSEVPSDDDEDEDDEGENNGEVFNLVKIEMIEKGDMELLPKNADSDVMKLQSDEQDDDENDSGDDSVESDGEDEEGDGGNGAEEQRGEQVTDKVGAKRKRDEKGGRGEEKVTPSKKRKR